MEDLTFGEQVKIILSRKGMTIKRLAELIEEKTGKKMSRQNLTQRLGRDNFQEQDMRMIAQILDCPFHLSIMTEAQAPVRSTAALEQEAIARTEAVEKAVKKMQETPAREEMEQGTTAQEDVREVPSGDVPAQEPPAAEERDMTIGELYEIHKELSELENNVKADGSAEEADREPERPKKERFHTGGLFLRRKNKDETDKQEQPEADKAEQSTRADRVVAAVQDER